MRECEAHNLPSYYIGPHRRVLIEMLEYKKRGEQARREAIVRIARQFEELGEYDKFMFAEE